MSKVEDSADSASAQTPDAQPTTDTTTAPARGSAIALEVTDSEHTTPLRGTDRAAARCVIKAAQRFSSTDLDSVEVTRYGTELDVKLRGDVALSGGRVEKYLTENYEVINWMSYSTGNTRVELRHEKDAR